MHSNDAAINYFMQNVQVRFSQNVLQVTWFSVALTGSFVDDVSVFFENWRHHLKHTKQFLQQIR